MIARVDHRIVCVLGTLLGVPGAAGFVTIGDAGFVVCLRFSEL
jgi:hypothetical protein